MVPYFEKKHRNKNELFIKCPTCGLVINSTYYNMSAEELASANNIHKSNQGEINTESSSWKSRLSRLAPQADLISQLYCCDFFQTDMKAVDYGGGDGLFAELVQEKYTEKMQTSDAKLSLKTYEQYLRIPEKSCYYDDNEMIEKSFDIAICSAVLEHMIGRKDVDRFFNLVKDDGIAVIHTLICESVPQDPDWFYISIPTHCTIWTNESMSRIFKQHGFVGCAYHLPSKMWLFFKDKEKYNRCKDISTQISGKWTFSDNFVDYWKVTPYH